MVLTVRKKIPFWPKLVSIFKDIVTICIEYVPFRPELHAKVNFVNLLKYFFKIVSKQVNFVSNLFNPCL